ncbi:MAG: alpha-2-macroglobulin family protein, partial [Huintestinicola sp.]
NVPRGYEYEYGNHDIFKGAPADTEITIELTRNYSVKTEKGSHYDFLQKRNIIDYKYESKTEDLGVYKVTTRNGKAVISDLPIKENNGSYKLSLSWKDSAGRDTVKECYPCGYDEYDYEYAYRYYTFETKIESGTYALSFTENQTIPFTLTRSSYSKEEECEGRILFIVHGNDFVDSRIFTDMDFDYTMTRECIPTVNVCGAYFDGRHVYPVHEYWLDFDYDPSERKIDLEISADKETYLPGETANITVKALYEDKTPASGASVLMSIVDEAAFALGDQYVDVLSDLYSSIYIPRAEQYFSYIQHTLDHTGGGEMGGGGDDWTIRKDFKNTAMFSELTADSTGTAHFSVKLPDNLTTWRATALAVSYRQGEESGKSSAVYAGNTRYPVVVRQPVFITPIMPDKFHTGDDIVLAANLRGADEVSITVSGNGVNKTLSGNSGSSVSFGKLPRGEYKALFKTEGTNGRDAAEYTFTVEDTLLEVPVVMVSDISELNTSDSLKWPVHISFFNKDYMLYTDVLWKLSEYHGSRTDTTIASDFAMKEFGFITEEEYLKNSVTLDSNGFVKLLNASEGDPGLSARLLAAVPEIIGNRISSDSYYSIINNRNSASADVSDAYLGLAAMGEPVMVQIRRLLADENSKFSEIEKLKLIAALAVLGDCETSSGYLSKYLADGKRTETDEGTQLCISSADDIESTKYVLVAAAAAGLPQADELARYLVNSKNVYDTAAPELIYYLKHYSPASVADATFSYNLNGEEKLVTLDRSFSTCLSFTEEQFKAADFKAVSGNIRTYMHYMGRVTDISEKKD